MPAPAPTTLTLDKNNYVLTAEGAYRLPPAVFLGPVDSLAGLITSNAVVRTPNALTIAGQSVTLAAHGGYTYLGITLPKLVLRTEFQADGRGSNTLSPVFSRSANTIPMAPNWVPPEDMILTLGICAGFGGYVPGKWTVRGGTDSLTSFLFAQKRGVAGFLLLPLPNVYENGCVCLGNRDPIHADTLSGLMEDVLCRFEANPWNTDLLYSPNNTRAMFKFGAADSQQVAVPDWAGLCRPVSHPAMDRIAAPNPVVVAAAPAVGDPSF